MERVLIADIGSHVDQDVEIRGWLYNLRSKGKLHFLQLRDGSGRIQGVAEENAVGAACAEIIRGLKMEASVTVRGKVRRDERAPSGFELTVTAVEVGAEPGGGLPDRQEGARDRLPAREPAPLAALVPARTR